MALVSPRKSKMAEILKALQRDHSQATAASFGGVTVRTMRKWLQKGRADDATPEMKQFADEFEKSQGKAEGRFAEIVMHEAIENGNWKAAMFILQKRYGWTERVKLDAEIERKVKVLGMERTRADIEYTKARTKRIEEEGDSAMLEKLVDVLNDSSPKAKSSDSPVH